jgi:hypothetical protein
VYDDHRPPGVVHERVGDAAEQGGLDRRLTTRADDHGTRLQLIRAPDEAPGHRGHAFQRHGRGVQSGGGCEAGALGRGRGGGLLGRLVDVVDGVIDHRLRQRGTRRPCSLPNRRPRRRHHSGGAGKQPAGVRDGLARRPGPVIGDEDRRL